MAHDVCPWWLGYWLASPIRKLRHNPKVILSPFVRTGMMILEPGPGMGFFTLPMAQMVGEGGRVVAVDIQPQMIKNLQRKAHRAGVAAQVECRLAGPSAMGTKDLAGKVDFVLAFAVVHELPDARAFFNESFVALKRGGRLLFSEPSDHIDKSEFEKSLNFARQVGFELESIPSIRANQSAVLIQRNL
jgi:ubiquinone/menaquinone biosynthesis C-methylase UbiE